MREVTLCWGSAVPPAFQDAIVATAKRLGYNPLQMNWLMACMAFETGCTFSPNVKNRAGSGATGLIQFMPSTALWLGTTTNELAGMSAVQQLLYVEKYFKMITGGKVPQTLASMYMVILMPSYIDKPDTAVLFYKPGTAYRQNSGLDKDNNGVITKAEAAAAVQRMYDQGISKFAKNVFWE